jgi:hypothetical protein
MGLLRQESLHAGFSRFRECKFGFLRPEVPEKRTASFLNAIELEFYISLSISIGIP